MRDSEAWNSGIASASRRPEAIGGAVLTDLVESLLIEKRKSRRWSIFFRCLAFLFLFLLLLSFSGLFSGLGKGVVGGLGGTRHTALVDISGVIAVDQEANAQSIVGSIERALQDSNTAGVILRINSPGGSPVQSGIIFDEILRLRNRHPNTPIHAVVGDVGASGGYYVAVAADRIYADKASIVGSIGVRMDSFGFDRAIELLGIERRTLTAGDNKALLDPFLPENPDHVAHMQSLLSDVHQQFIAAVKRGRGDRLKDNPELYSGLVWTGESAVRQGLVDKLANEGYVAREIIGAPDIIDFTRRQDVFERLSGRLSAGISALINEWLKQGVSAPPAVVMQ